MLELARRKMDETVIRVIDDEFQVATFLNLTPEDISGSGRIRPVAARHFAEVAERVQNVTNRYQMLMGDPLLMQHFSSVNLAKMFEELLDLEQFKLVEPYVRLAEAAEAQQLQNQHDEETMMAIQTPSGLTPDDFDEGPGVLA